MPPHLQIAIPLAAWCALRIGELLGLERSDLEHLDDPCARCSTSAGSGT
ncbi:MULTISPECIES: hypothetical protein [unclassified Ornithinimicrobium]